MKGSGTALYHQCTYLLLSEFQSDKVPDYVIYFSITKLQWCVNNSAVRWICHLCNNGRVVTFFQHLLKSLCLKECHSGLCNMLATSQQFIQKNKKQTSLSYHHVLYRAWQVFGKLQPRAPLAHANLFWHIKKTKTGMQLTTPIKQTVLSTAQE